MGLLSAYFTVKRICVIILITTTALTSVLGSPKLKEAITNSASSADNNHDITMETDTDTDTSAQQTTDDNYEIIIDQDKVETTTTLPYPFPNWVGPQYAITPNHPDESWAVIRVLRYPGISLGYKNDVEWTYAAFIPKFSELRSRGADIIREYYAAQYESAKLEGDAFRLDDTITDYSSQCNIHSYSDWDSYTVGNHLIVTWAYDWYGGGAHGAHYYYAEQFDMNTGKLLTIDDVFIDFETAAPILGSLVTKHLIENCDWYGYYGATFTDNIFGYEQYISGGNADISFTDGSQSLLFMLEENGIVFIFNEYAIDCYAAGAFFALVPYEELQDILKLDISFKN